jgi:hypothetical protein
VSEEVERPGGALGQMTKLASEFLGLFHRETLAMDMPCRINQFTNA